MTELTKKDTYNPEHSPFFQGWEYTGNRLQKALKLGAKKPLFKTVEQDAMDKWYEHKGTKTILGFADTYPETNVETVDEAGNKKTITLKKWVLARDEEELYQYYKKSPWVYRCVDIKAKSFASMEWSVYPKEDTKLEPLDETQDVVRVLKEVNPEINWQDLASTISKDLDIHGKAFIWKIRTGADPKTVDGEIKFLQRLNPTSMKVESDSTGISHFEQMVNGQRRVYARENVIYLRDYDPDDDFGSISPIQASSYAIKVEVEANKHLADFFANRAMPDVLMSSPDKVSESDINRLIGLWNKQYKGAGKQHKTGFLSHGFKPEFMQYAPKDLALEEIRKEARRAICASLGVPMSLAGASEAANYATMTEQRKSLYTETIIPRARYIQGVLNAEYCNEFDGSLFFTFEPEKLEVMTETTAEKATYLGNLVEKKIIKPETAAIALGFDAIDVPEPQAVPDFTPQNNGFGNKEEDDSKTIAALRKFKRKAVRRMKDSQSAKCTFNSEHITDGVIETIQEKLEKAQDLGEVVSIFDDFGCK